MTTASLLLAAAVAVAAAVLDLMTEGPPLWSVLLAVALIVAAGQLAQLGLPFRQRSTTLLGAAAGVLAVVLAAGIGALAWLLVAGRLPLAIEQPLVDAALVGVLTAGVVSAV
ncbi:MAG: hypothetical protein ABWZ98_16255, partial [Nakamurella sp.]